MSQHKSAFDNVREVISNYIKNFVAAALKEQIDSVKEMAWVYLRILFRKMALFALALTLFLIGFVYVTFGLVKALATMIPEWASLIVIGVVISALGYILFRQASKKPGELQSKN